MKHNSHTQRKITVLGDVIESDLKPFIGFSNHEGTQRRVVVRGYAIA